MTCSKFHTLSSLKTFLHFNCTWTMNSFHPSSAFPPQPPGIKITSSLEAIRLRHRHFWEYLEGWFLLHRDGPDRRRAAKEILYAPGQLHIYSLNDVSWRALLQKWKCLSASNEPQKYHQPTSAMTAVIKYLPDTFKAV